LRAQLFCSAAWTGRTKAILDVQMPGMDGYTVAAELRRRKETVDMPILVLTSLGTHPSAGT
jgi:CheY-like chemotaxis protein